MSKDHMKFLAGRKEYNGSLSNSSCWQQNSNQSDITSLSDVNVSDDLLEQYMNSSAAVDESISIHSYESGTSDVSEVVLRRGRAPFAPSTSTPSKSFRDSDLISVDSVGGKRLSEGHQLSASVSVDFVPSKPVNEVRGDGWRGGGGNGRERDRGVEKGKR